MSQTSSPAERIERIRYVSGLALSDIAVMLDITPSYLTHIKNDSFISETIAKKLQSLCEALEKECDLYRGPLFVRKPHMTKDEQAQRKNHVISTFMAKYNL